MRRQNPHLLFASGWLGSGAASQRCRPNLQRSRTPTRRIAKWQCSRVLVINTKGGGHGVIGLHLSHSLLADGHSVDLVQLGPETESGPCGQYSALQTQYDGSFTYRFEGSAPTVYDTAYNAVYDNNAKTVEDIQGAISAGKSGAEVFYISSCGSYKYNPSLAPHLVGDDASGAVTDVEDALREAGVSAASFRPIYIIGEYSSKRDYLDYFFDRIVRGRPVPLPGNGSELTSVTDVRDVAAMLHAALGKGLKNEVFNSVNTRCISHEGIVHMCAKACGKEPNIVFYDPKKAESQVDGFKLKSAYPLRVQHFYADPCEAQVKLGWSPEYSGDKNLLQGAINEDFEEYVRLGLDKVQKSFDMDEAILGAAV